MISSNSRIRGPWARAGSALTIAAVALALAAFAADPGAARAGWPVPAGGESASGDPEVLFTFDDGPHEKHTAAILDELTKRDIKSIFFWVGRKITRGESNEAHMELIQRAVREGHLVANHTINHPNLCAVEETEAAAEIDDNADALRKAAELPILLFRAPYGAHCQRLRRMLEERSLDHIHWDIDPQEWRHHNTKRTVKFVTNKLKRLDGRAIVLLHDTHRVTVKALPKILDWIEKENLRRQKTGKKRPIRVINAVDYLSERMDTRVLDWMVSNAFSSAEQLQATVARLIP